MMKNKSPLFSSSLVYPIHIVLLISIQITLILLIFALNFFNLFSNRIILGVIISVIFSILADIVISILLVLFNLPFKLYSNYLIVPFCYPLRKNFQGGRKIDFELISFIIYDDNEIVIFTSDHRIARVPKRNYNKFGSSNFLKIIKKIRIKIYSIDEVNAKIGNEKLTMNTVVTRGVDIFEKT
jgi:hypothetical protein